MTEESKIKYITYFMVIFITLPYYFKISLLFFIHSFLFHYFMSQIYSLLVDFDTFIRILLILNIQPKVRNGERWYQLLLKHLSLLSYRYIEECIQNSRIVIDVLELYLCLHCRGRKLCFLWKVVDESECCAIQSQLRIL